MGSATTEQGVARGLAISGANDKNGFHDGILVGADPTHIRMSPDRKQWRRIFRDVPAKAIKLAYGETKGGHVWHTHKHADGTPCGEDVGHDAARECLSEEDYLKYFACADV
ncbi:MAG: hypothetical protein QMD08_07970 [Actinomycetota bacterium]|nr:hypothetical protein [Actinomycetota bacterium]